MPGKSEKGDRSNLPERPEGCCAQIGPVPFLPRSWTPQYWQVLWSRLKMFRRLKVTVATGSRS